MNNNFFIRTMIFLMITLSSCNNLVGEKKGFMKEINDLKESKIDSLILIKIDSIKTKYFLPKSPIVQAKHSFYDMEKKSHILKEYLINENRNYVIYPSDILKITDKYILLLLKQDIEVRAATFKLNGEPIETILISDAAGNNEWRAKRNFKYNPVRYEFIFTDTGSDTEWIIFPTSGKNIVSYKKESKIGVKGNGRFFLISKKDLELKL